MRPAGRAGLRSARFTTRPRIRCRRETYVGTSQHGRGGKESLVPLAAIKLPARPVGHQIELDVEAVSVGVLQTCGQVGLGRCVGAMAQRAPGEVDPNAADLLLDSGARRLLTARLESSAGEGIPARRAIPCSVMLACRLSSRSPIPSASAIARSAHSRVGSASSASLWSVASTAHADASARPGGRRCSSDTARSADSAPRRRGPGTKARLRARSARLPRPGRRRVLAMTDEGALERLDRARGVVDEKAAPAISPLQTDPARAAGGWPAANGNARAYWAAASRWAPCSDAYAAAAGAKRSTASRSPAASA